VGGRRKSAGDRLGRAVAGLAEMGVEVDESRRDDDAPVVDAVRVGAANEISVPPGQNEASRLGRALDELLISLKRERSALQTLNAELDQRVAARTREIERLGEQTRYAAVVRERLKIARDLHDTLAHSMMAMLTEIRLLKRLAAIDPTALADELTRAEEPVARAAAVLHRELIDGN